MLVGVKTCGKCSIEKNTTEFHKNEARPQGIETYCKECNNQRLREAYAKDPQSKITKTRQYHLDHPEWSKNTQRKWHQDNKERRYQKVKDRLATDPEFLKYRRDLVARKERERRAQKANTEVTKVTKNDYNNILLEFNNQCWICEVKLTQVVWDHVQPLAKGGSHSVDNLRPACNPCNVRKNATWPFTDKMKETIANEVRNLTESKEVMP